MQRVFKAILAVIFALTLALGSFVGGALFERFAESSTLVTPAPTAATASRGGLPLLVGEVQGLMRSEALKPASEESMTTNAIDGLLASLGDKYATYFDPKDNKEFVMGNKGEFFGVGMTVGLQESTPTVVTVFAGSPAQKAGVKSGDGILSVDGVRKAKWDLDDVVSRIRGPIGTKVTLVISREGVAKPLTFTITRARISIPNIKSELVGRDVGLIRLYQFNEKAATDVRDAMRALERKGAKGFILDLRENPGGLLRSSVQVVSLYVASGVVVRVDARGKPEEKDMTTGGFATDKPLVVLIDGMSASASEIVAGALQDYKRAVIVGEKSYGKGSVQTIRDLSNGGAIKLTMAHYLTPKGRVIDGKGVVPDVVVKMDPHLQAKKGTDVQLKAAVAVLRGKF